MKRINRLMDFSLPSALIKYLSILDTFIKEKINSLQAKGYNDRLFDDRREHSRSDWDNQGLSRKDWERLPNEAMRLADDSGHLRLALPKEYGGQGYSQTDLWIAIIRDYLAAKGLGLHNDLQNEHSIVGNFPVVLMFREIGVQAQKADFVQGTLGETRSLSFTWIRQLLRRLGKRVRPPSGPSEASVHPIPNSVWCKPDAAPSPQQYLVAGGWRSCCSHPRLCHSGYRGGKSAVAAYYRAEAAARQWGRQVAVRRSLL